jgi:hypothetical protein
MGTFDTKFEVPDLANVKNVARMSSVVWSAQRIPASDVVGSADNKAKLQKSHPLVHENLKYLPSVTHTFRRNQTLYVYAEVYEPSLNENSRLPAVAATVTVYKGNKQVLESRPVTVSALRQGRASTASIAMELPLKDLEPGEYTAQLSVIDRLGGKFAFERDPLVILTR